MFVESDFKEDRETEIKRIISEFPLATIVAQTEDGMVAEHLPLMQQNDEYLFGHMSLQNSLYTNQILNQHVLCIFKGDDAYISANYYPSKFVDHKKVPTWNYQVVHVYGEIKFFSDHKTKLAMIGQLTKQQEQMTNGDQAWKMSDAPKAYLLEMLDHLIAFKITIHKVIAKSKLSQNRDNQDFNNVIVQLEQKGKVAVANAMKGIMNQ